MPSQKIKNNPKKPNLKKKKSKKESSMRERKKIPQFEKSNLRQKEGGLVELKTADRGLSQD